MNEETSTIVAQLENLGSSLFGVAKKLDGLDRQLKEAKTELGPHIQALQSFFTDHAALLLGPSPSAGPELGQVNEAIQKLSQGDDQEQILEIFLEESERHVDRAILFLQKDDVYGPWKSLGFPSVTIESVVAAAAEDPIVRAARRQRILYRAEGLAEAFPWLNQAGDLPRAAVCVPLVFGDSVPVVFYGDAGRGIALDSLELLSHITTLVLKNHYLQVLLQEPPKAEVSEPVAAPATAPPEAKPAEPSPPEPAEPEPAEPQPEPATLEPEAPAPTKEEVRLTPEADQPQPEASPDAGPAEAAEAEFVGEEVPHEEFAVETAEEETPPEFHEPEEEVVQAGEDERIATAAPPASTPPAEPPQAPPEAESPAEPAPAPDELAGYHNEARRFARLLVSEIMLYNEEEVERGRQEDDLYQRLKADIERSRSMYQKRANPAVTSSVDHFHEELVRVLADGREERLGAEYPGPQLA